MGARISIKFTDGVETSPTLFSHWGGKDFLSEVKDYLKDLKKWTEENGTSYPLGRMEVGTVMVDLIRHLSNHLDRVKSDLYLGKTENDGDDSDYGHHEIDLRKYRVRDI